jgi:hypothetical protein
LEVRTSRAPPEFMNQVSIVCQCFGYIEHV